MQVSASATIKLSYLIVESRKLCYHPVPFSSLQGDLTLLETGCLIIPVEVNNFADKLFNWSFWCN